MICCGGGGGRGGSREACPSGFRKRPGSMKEEGVSSERTRSVKRAISGVVGGDDRKTSLDLRWSGDDGGDVGGSGGDGWEKVGGGCGMCICFFRGGGLSSARRRAV